MRICGFIKITSFSSRKLFMKYALFITLLSLAFVSQFVLPKSIAARGDGAHVSGKLLKADGKPLAYTEIELVPINSEKQSSDARLLAISTTGGAFNFRNIPDGEYTLSINFDEKPSTTSPYETFFYPTATERDDAQILKIEAATQTNNLVFRLPPPLAQKRVSGKIIGVDGLPVANAFVAMKDVEYDDFSMSLDTKTDRSGNFTLVGFVSRFYQIAAIKFDRIPDISAPDPKPLTRGNTPIFKLDAATKPFTIVLRPIEKEIELPDRNVGMLILEY